MLILASDLKRIKTKRAGVIPYVYIYGHIYFLLGVDEKTGELSDFGGGRKRTEDSCSTALREFMEETISIFEEQAYISISKLDVAVIDNNCNMSIVFKELKSTWFEKAIGSFSKKRMFETRKKNLEIHSIKWVDHGAMRRLLYEDRRKMWSKIKFFLVKNIGDFDEFINILINCHKNIE